MTYFNVHQYVCRNRLMWVADAKYTHFLHLTIIFTDTSRTQTNWTLQINGEAIPTFQAQLHLQELVLTTIIL